MIANLQIPSPVQQIELPFLKEKGIELFIKRDDLIHAQIQGNKWRKLKYNLIEARNKQCKTLLTFGGTYSNHIYATAAAASAFGFECIGVIRGEKPPVLSATLQFALAEGMQLYFVSRAAYTDKVGIIKEWQKMHNDLYVIPEGGTNMPALKGVEEMVQETGTDHDHYCVAVGTGGTVAGMIAGLNGNAQVIGFSSLKGEDALTTSINSLVQEYTGKSFSNFAINFDYHFGGYAKVQPELVTFIKRFKQDTGIQLEPVYTGKMFYGLFDLIRKNYFPPSSRILAVHTGGLQGLSGFQQYF